MSNSEPPMAERELAAAGSDPPLRTQQPPVPDAQVADVSGILHEQADRLTEEAAHTTQRADQSRAAAVRLDEQAEDLHQRAEHLHEQADHLGDTIKPDDICSS
jgi:small-conductance mechanosensitive channel